MAVATVDVSARGNEEAQEGQSGGEAKPRHREGIRCYVGAASAAECRNGHVRFCWFARANQFTQTRRGRRVSGWF